MFHVPCGMQHLSGFVIRNIRQDIIKLMESREILVQVHVAGVGDVRDPCEVTVWKKWRYWNCWNDINVALDSWMVNFLKVGRVAQSVQRLTKSWTVRDRNPVGTRFSARPASCKMGTGSFPGGKVRPGRAVDHSPLLVPRSCKSTAIPLPTLWATPGL